MIPCAVKYGCYCCHEEGCAFMWKLHKILLASLVLNSHILLSTHQKIWFFIITSFCIAKKCAAAASNYSPPWSSPSGLWDFQLLTIMGVVHKPWAIHVSGSCKDLVYPTIERKYKSILHRKYQSYTQLEKHHVLKVENWSLSNIH
jgi:hypothetical protein